MSNPILNLNIWFTSDTTPHLLRLNFMSLYYPQTKKHELKKKVIISWNELEKLKPLVQQKINELNSRNGHQQFSGFFSNGKANFD
ncbi:hypothetical protein MTR_6g083950 [Medicago truncatula]|uniref:Uncharacterized protein n=1 Tax=Medicago truncatula TaxID=3880 RepID=G7KN02_MEDTR|nr:hypothetical protein MTR_6g083950 [Medicago truncatula]